MLGFIRVGFPQSGEGYPSRTDCVAIVNFPEAEYNRERLQRPPRSRSAGARTIPGAEIFDV